MEKFLRNLYRKFLNFDKKYYLNDAKLWFGVEKLNLNERILKNFYENYQKTPFFSFLAKIKDIIYSKNVFDYILKNSTEDCDLWYYLRFLEKEKVVKVKKNGKVLILNRKILEVLPRPQRSKEIKEKIERKIKTKIKGREPIINLFQKFQNYKINKEWDQLPISQESGIFVVERILEKLPYYKKFLFVGDDDFLSVILGLANPKIESLVIDIDENLLLAINNLASKFNLKIETKKTDIRKRIPLKENFVGFLTNPVYTEEGVKEFMKYGISQLGEDGGVVFLELGDEILGNRFLFLQDFWTKQNLILEELIPKKIYYPRLILDKEDEIISKRLFSMIDKKIVKKNPKLGASLYIFEYLPFKIKRIKFKTPIYSYL